MDESKQRSDSNISEEENQFDAADLIHSATFNPDEVGSHLKSDDFNHRKTMTHAELINRVIMPYDDC